MTSSRLLRPGPSVGLLLLLLVLPAAPAAAQIVVVDETTGAVYEGLIDGYPGLAALDGEPDFGDYPLAAALKAGVIEERAIAEYPLPAPVSGAGIRSATIVFNIDDVLANYGPGTDFSGRAAQRLHLHLYAGNGVAELADFKRVERPSHPVDTTSHGTVTDATLRQSGPLVIRVDVTADAKALIAAGARHLGVVWRTDDSPTATSIDDLGDGGAGPPGVNGARMPYLEIEIAPAASPTPTATPPAAPSATATRQAPPTATFSRSATPSPSPLPATETPTPSRTPSSPTPTVPYIAGDATCDGSLDRADLEGLPRVLFDDETAAHCPQADANGDGRVGAADLIALADFLVAPPQ